MTITAAEQLLIEMINRARLDPVTEAARFGVGLNDGLAAGTISEDAKQALSPNVLLHASSDTHGQWMLDVNTFSHQGENGNSPKDRMENAGYVFEGSYYSGENITYRGSTGSINLNQLMEDHHHRDFFLSEGHRQNMLTDGYRELGVSQIEGIFTNSAGTNFNASMVTENFATTGSDVFVTGVAYSDTDSDNFYSIGEGQSGVAVSAQGTTTSTLAAGGYGIAIAPTGQASVSIGGISMTLDASSGNAKIDLVDGTKILTSVSTTLTSQADELTALGFTEIDLRGHSSDDRLNGNRNDNALHGNGGDDVLSGGGGNDSLFGGAGTDKAIFDFSLASSSVNASSSGGLTITSGGETTVVEGVENFVFTDTSTTYSALRGVDDDQILVGTHGDADALFGGSGSDVIYGDGVSLAHMGMAPFQVYRLYEATFGRLPDHDGLEGWAKDLFEGTQSLEGAAAAFIGSPEFQNRYGVNPDDSSFVRALYDNVLNRQPSQSEESAWVDLLQSGMERAAVVIGFSESGEFVNGTRADATSLINDQTDSMWQGIVYRLYVATLAREPDQGGFESFLDTLGSGAATYDSVPQNFINSIEFQNTYGALDNPEFVDLLYQNVLGRSADSEGLSGWLDAMNNGSSRSDVVQGFAQSGEFTNASSDALSSWLRGIGGDTLSAGGGDDIMIGGAGADTFVFDRADGGDHRVLDLEAWDFVELTNFGYASDAQAIAQFETVGDDVVFDDQGLRITFEDTALSLITDDLIVI